MTGHKPLRLPCHRRGSLVGGSSCGTHIAGVSAEAAGGGQKELNCSVEGQWAGVFVQATKVEKVKKQESKKYIKTLKPRLEKCLKDSSGLDISNVQYSLLWCELP